MRHDFRLNRVGCGIPGQLRPRSGPYRSNRHRAHRSPSIARPSTARRSLASLLERLPAIMPPVATGSSDRRPQLRLG